MLRAVVVLSLLWSLSAFAQAIVPDRELDIVRQNFNVGNYKEALSRARNAMEVSNFSDFQRAELHKYAGLSSFNLGDTPSAEQHFLALLQLNPDYVLDPFAYPPPVIRVFEEVKRRNADALNVIRQQIALREEQTRREAAEKEKAKAAAEEARRKLEALSQSVTTTTVERRSFLVNFIPFGAGQFQQGRTGMGAIFAAVEAVLALTSAVSYLVITRLYEDYQYTDPDSLYPTNFTVTVHRIAPGLRNSADAWKAAKYTSAIGFYAVWAVGVGEALWHHQDEVVTTQTRRLDELTPPLTPAKAATPKVFLFPTAGGFGAGLNLRF